jgi:hypothetical protein
MQLKLNSTHISNHFIVTGSVEQCGAPSVRTTISMDHFNMENYMLADALSWTELIGIYREIQ